MITVNSIDNTTFEVVVEGTTTTTHRVTVPHSYYERLTKKRVATDVLVERSFKFLLQRESNTSILRSFEL
jgi:trans-aconitate methyltransferase